MGYFKRPSSHPLQMLIIKCHHKYFLVFQTKSAVAEAEHLKLERNDFYLGLFFFPNSSTGLLIENPASVWCCKAMLMPATDSGHPSVWGRVRGQVAHRPCAFSWLQTHRHGICVEVRGQPQCYSSGAFCFLSFAETRVLDSLGLPQVD